jgi:quinol monooxygenase YgiN
MQYTQLATITTKTGQMRDCLRTLETELLPAARKETGFVAYTVAKTGESTAVAFSIWQTREQAERAIKSFDKWTKESANKLIDSAHSHVGELPFVAFTGDLKGYASPAPASPASPVAAARN